MVGHVSALYYYCTYSGQKNVRVKNYFFSTGPGYMTSLSLLSPSGAEDYSLLATRYRCNIMQTTIMQPTTSKKVADENPYSKGANRTVCPFV